MLICSPGMCIVVQMATGSSRLDLLSVRSGRFTMQASNIKGLKREEQNIKWAAGMCICT